MSEIFLNPPLQEAVCELRFESKNWDPTIPGILYSLIESDFPKRESVQEGKVEFFIDPRVKQDPKISHSENEFPKFSNEEGNIFAVFRKNLVSIHHIKPYTNWNDFLSKIKLVFEKYSEVAVPTKLSRIGLRYINKISIPVDGYIFSDYFNMVQSPLSGIIDEESIAAIQNGVLFNDAENLIKMQFASLNKNEEKVEYILDVDYFLTNPSGSENIDNWLARAHDKIESIFLGSIKEKTKELFLS